VSQRYATRILIALAAITVVLGMIGYAHAPLGAEDGLNTGPGVWRFFDYLYMSVQLLALSGRDVKGEPLLLIARWTGALFAFGVVVRVLAPPVGERLLWLRLRLLSGHTVVIGLGDKGRAFLADAGSRGPVVAIDLAPIDIDTLGDATRSESEWRTIRHNTYLLRGDANRRRWLLRLSLKKAARVFVVTQSDALNVEIARAVALHFAAHRTRDDPLTLFAHVGHASVTDDLLADLSVPPSVEVRPFSLPGLAARLLVSRWPLAVAAREQGATRMNLVFVGFDPFAEALLLHALRLGPLGDQGRPRITIFTPAAATVRMRLEQNYPELGELVDPPIAVRERDLAVDLSGAELAEAEGRDGRTPVTAIFVVAATDAEAFLLARRVRRVTARSERWPGPLFVQLRRTEQYRGSLSTLAACKALADVVEPFGALKDLCSEAALRDWHERLAARLHAGYLDDERTTAVQDRDSPAKQGWHEISEEFREANRRAVDHFPLKLATAGWIVRGEIPLLAKPLALDDGAVDRLARLEHASWTNEKLLAGWRPSAERDDRRRFHDYLVEYDRLGAAQQKDISQLRRIEALLQAPWDRALLNESGQQPEEAGPTVFRERTIGLAGHLLISLENARAVATAVSGLLATLRAEERLGPRGEEFWTLVTPLAPGADYVLARLICRELGEIAQANQPVRRYRLLVVRALSPRQLARAYLARAAERPDASPDGVRPATHKDFSGATRADSVATIAALLDELVQNQSACERVIDLGAPGEAAPTGSHDGFESANRYLLERCDDLVAVLDPARYGQRRPFDPGGWQTLDSRLLPAAGTGALVGAWLRRAPRRYTAVRPISPTGLHPIEIE
jgi:hypothetical protein